MTHEVLVVDDAESVVKLLSMSLSELGYTVRSAGTGQQAMEAIHKGFSGCVLLDLNLPDYTGLELFSAIRQVDESLPIIIVTAHGTVDMAIEAIRQGAFDFLVKTDALLERVAVSTKNAFMQLELHSRVKQLSNQLESRFQFGHILSQSSAMERVFELMSHAADSRITVLIEGESGTGKELIARSLHYNGNRKNRPFIPINVAGIPHTLLESELFGYEKGAFTGAANRKRGKFEIANGGTLFLDEIGEMPLVLQSKLLRVLQEREIERIGGNTRIKLDVRVVCATNINLREAVRKGTFREDLYYRLAVFPINVPPLRDRPADIPILAKHFISEYSAEEGKHLTSFSDDAMQVLEQYDYPGNVRELENLISHAVVVSRGPQITVGDLPSNLLDGGWRDDAAAQNQVRMDRLLSSAITSRDQIPTMQEIESHVIQRAVQLCEGNLVQAARRLGISRATIYRRIAKLGITRL